MTTPTGKRQRRRGRKRKGNPQADAGAQATQSTNTDDPVGRGEDDESRPSDAAQQRRRAEANEQAASKPGDLFDTDVDFRALGLNENVLKGVERHGFRYPTVVQRRVIPLVLEGRDILGQSKTGSGKTAAFGLPIMHLADPAKPFEAMILVPTRELALQVAREMRELGADTGHHIVPVYGGQPIKIQANKLEKGPSIIVGTPGRVMDMHDRNLLPYKSMRFIVLDEVDRMLDIGFRDDITSILRAMPTERQTIFVSATISPEIETLARRFLHNPEKLELSASRSLTVEQVEQHYFSVEPWDKKRLLVHLLKRENPSLALVFCRTKQTVDALVEYLQRKGVESRAMHGDMYQRQRNRVMQQLRDGELTVLVCSDLASRGLDVDNITHVINFDVPDDPEQYVHRIGRTARVGRGGVAWALVTPEQGALLSAIERYANVEIPIKTYDDFKPGPVPDAVVAERELEANRRETARSGLSRSPTVPPAHTPQKADPSQFPGGVVPSAAPSRRLGGRVKTRRR